MSDLLPKDLDEMLPGDVSGGDGYLTFSTEVAFALIREAKRAREGDEEADDVCQALVEATAELHDTQDERDAARAELDKLRRVEGALLDVVGRGVLDAGALAVAMEALDDVGDWRCSQGACGHQAGECATS